ncbi:MAG: WD40 repeat protein/tRNA A-37 threonylcarbamoyl transferase component Bud32 [Bacteroidia bacterium]|jgi:WD40 repeat protein/tRNA A-37 threonylcarbamoyl transferase component Bud32
MPTAACSYSKPCMAKRDLEDTPENPEEGSTTHGVAPKLTAFAKQLRKRYGTEIDPDISLDPDFAKDEADGTPVEKGETPAKQRLSRLSNLTPGDFRYKYKEEIGRGGMGVVLKVRDRDLQRSLAMKVLISSGTPGSDETPRDHRKLTRFLEEAQITGQLDHPGVVSVHELGMDARGRPFFTMRLVRGHTLKEVFAAIEGSKKVPGLEDWTRNRALATLLRVCETIAFSHSKNVIHRDLKPSNIMVGRFGETYVMDWGLAKILGRDEERNIAPKVEQEQDESISIVHSDRRSETDNDPDSPLLTMDGDVVGTPAYMAPEQAKGQLEKVGTSADVYSLGAILYHLLTGRTPYSDEDSRQNQHVVLMRVLSGPPEPIHKLRKGVPVELAAICEHAMSYSRKKRYLTVQEFSMDLRAYLEGRVVVAHETGSIAEFKKWVVRNKAMATVSAFAVVALVSTLGRISYINATHNTKLDKSNAELIVATQKAERNASEVEASARAIKAASLATERAAYSSRMNAAHLSLRLGETAAARELLDSAQVEYRGWEWDHINLASDTSLQVWETGLTNSIEVAYSPNGLLTAAVQSSGRSEIQIRSAVDGNLTKSLKSLPLSVTGLDFDSTSQRLAISCADSTVRVVELFTGQEVIFDLDSSAEAVDFGPKGMLACATSASGVVVWDTMAQEDGSPSQALYNSDITEKLTSVKFSSTGTFLAASSEDGLVYVWNLKTGDQLQLPLSEGIITEVAFHPTTDIMAVCSNDGLVRIIRLKSGKALTLADRPLIDAYATDCVFLPDGRVMTACSDGLLRLLNIQDTTITLVQGHSANVSSIAIDNLGMSLVTGSSDGTMRLWSRLSFQATTMLAGHEEDITALGFSANGDVIATASMDATIRLWDSNTAETMQVLRGHDKFVKCLAFSLDGQWLASGTGDRSEVDPETGKRTKLKSEIRLWDAKSGDFFTVFQHHTKYLTDMAFSPDSRFLAVASGDKTCSVWNVEEESLVATLDLEDTVANALVWNSAGTRILTGASNGAVQEWDPFRPQAPLKTHDLGTGVLDLIYGLDDTEFIVGCLDASVQIWTLGGQLLHKLKGHSYGVRSVDLAPDGNRLITRSHDGSMILWNTQPWGAPLTLNSVVRSGSPIINSSVQDASFSPDGKRILSSQGAVAEIWETTHSSNRHNSMKNAKGVGDFVNELFEDYANPWDIIKSINADSTISGDLRRAALRRVTMTASDPELQAERAWETVMKSSATAKGYANALVLAELALKLEPENLDYRGARAAALYRTGRYEEALEILTNLEDLSWNTGTEPHPAGPIFLAMAAYQLGDDDLAKQTLEGLEPLMQRPLWARLAGGLFEEAKALVLTWD